VEDRSNVQRSTLIVERGKRMDEVGWVGLAFMVLGLGLKAAIGDTRSGGSTEGNEENEEARLPSFPSLPSVEFCAHGSVFLAHASRRLDQAEELGRHVGRHGHGLETGEGLILNRQPGTLDGGPAFHGVVDRS